VISLFIEPFCRKHNIISIFIVHSLVQELIRHRVNSLDILSTRLYHFTEKKAIKNSTYSVAISKYMRKHIQSIKKTKNNIIDLPNAIDIEFFAGAATNRTIDILFVGRLAREKGAMVLLNALAILSTKPSVYILGDGPDRQQLTAAAKSFNFDNIHFMGHIPHREINNWLCRTKLSIVPSWCEPQGIILMESMASGAALIGTNGGAIPEYIQHNKNGLLFPPGNTLALAEAIESLLNDPIKRNKLAKAALQTVKRCNRTKFSASLEKFVSCINTSFKTLKNNESDKIKQYT
jgi:glycosyltransferase involved in cell wall biosynthesis